MPEAPSTPYNVLFICTGNSARSILAEALVNDLGQGRFVGYSAGSHPSPNGPHPYAIDLLKQLNHDTSFARSKDWSEFAGPGTPDMDFIFTVCDNTAAEPCPLWPGQPVSAHWGVPDPVRAGGSEAERRLAFAEAYRQLRNRISIFVNLPLEDLDALALKERLDDIGRTTLPGEADDALA